MTLSAPSTVQAVPELAAFLRRGVAQSLAKPEQPLHPRRHSAAASFGTKGASEKPAGRLVVLPSGGTSAQKPREGRLSSRWAVWQDDHG